MALDLYYLTARYPDALPENAVPAEEFTEEMSSEALKMAQVFLEKSKKEIQV